MSDAVVFQSDDGSGRVWIVDDGNGKSWYKAGADAGWVAFKDVKGLPLAVDLAENFFVAWQPGVAALLTVAP